MLTHIDIQNFVLVDKLSLDFSNGLHVLTGETGAGKSIWVDAIQLALGGRAESNMIRQGQSRCDISLSFNLINMPNASEWLREHQLDQSSDECIIRRVLQSEGPSRSTINGVPCPLHLIREFSELILTIHGQHQQQDLLKSDGQQQQLDRYGQHDALINKIQQLYQQWQTNDDEIKILQHNLTHRHSELDLLRFQITELDQLNLQENEWQQLSDTHKQFHHAGQWQQQLQQALTLLIDDEKNAALNQVYRATHLLNNIRSDNEKLNTCKQLLTDAAIYLQEAGNGLQEYNNKLLTNPQKLADIEERLNLIHHLARKHRVSPPDLFNIQQSLVNKITMLENAESQLVKLESEQIKFLDQYQDIAKELTGRREEATLALNQQVTSWMQQLGMQGGRFQIALEKIDEPIHHLGNERVRFLVSTNPGQNFQPLQKIASGGELSRLHLALQVITAQKEQTATLIFDEVDVGIGGQTAAIVGKLLHQLGKKTQVLCITHLPQVAAYGHHHYKVSKLIENKTTRSDINPLSNSERRQELARMLGGETITEQSLAHANEMLTSVESMETV